MRVCEKCGGIGKVQDDKLLGLSLGGKRESMGATLRSLAKIMGYSASYICDLEHGRRRWSAGLEKKYHWALDQYFKGEKTRD